MMMRDSTQFNSVFFGTIGLIMTMTFFSPIAVYAPSHPEIQPIDEPRVLPDNLFYGLKLAYETLQENFTFQEDRKAELLLKHAQERDREAEVLERQMKTIPLDRLKEIQADKILKAELIIIKIETAHKIDIQKQEQQKLSEQFARSGSDEERALIQRQQQILERESNLVEPSLRPRLVEGDITIAEVLQRDSPVKIVPVDDIMDNDSDETVIAKLRDRLQNAFSTSQITEIRAKFIEVTQETDIDRKRLLADNLDKVINNPIVNISCFGRVDTLSIAEASDPVTALQDQCVILRAVDKEALRDMASDLG